MNSFTSSLIEDLGYTQSSNFIPPKTATYLARGELSFAIRRIIGTCTELTKEIAPCEFYGMYVLQEKRAAAPTPIVYVFEADDAVTQRIHKVVWNQNLVPFLIMVSNAAVRVYPGFDFNLHSDSSILSAPITTSGVVRLLDDFKSDSIDNGDIWQRWGEAVDPAKRVDEKLLADLIALDQALQEDVLPRRTAHGLIGNFVYLYYLRHRNILSNRKLEKWGIEPSSVFGRRATLKAIRNVNAELQEWLNGSVFQLGDALDNTSQAQLQLVASVFCGDSVKGQLHLDFQAYDFAHIPIETLSCVYEQFLHDSGSEEGISRGKQLGAYYTPIPLADYVITEMEIKRSLDASTKVLDPSCGSGTFLVACYRRLVEKRIHDQSRQLKATELREILTDQIFGIDRDDDACRVAELSLILTLLDYINPPDLENSNFKLPALRDENIFKADFFQPSAPWNINQWKFDWIIGNPPWVEVKGEPGLDHEHHDIWEWIKLKKTSYPVGGNQIAEAFLWKTTEHLGKSGVAGLLVPAMTWFKKESTSFRQEFFAQNSIWCLANFSNLMEVLFAGRSRSPASCVFFRCHDPHRQHQIVTFAPFVAEQLANRSQDRGRRKTTWNIVVNGAELRSVPNSSAIEGDGLVWKLAMWGSALDGRILQRMGAKFTPFEKFASENHLIAHQGLELKNHSTSTEEPLEKHPELEGKLKVVPTALRKVGRIFEFPERALAKIGLDKIYLRKGRVELPMKVSEPPHVIVDAARRFAVFSNIFLAVPHWYIGVKGDSGSERLLKALALYLASDFCQYHQFFVSQKWGIDQNYAALHSLRRLPIALKLSDAELGRWSELYDELASLSEKSFKSPGLLSSEQRQLEKLIYAVNDKVFELLGLRMLERWLVEDFVHLNLELRQGKITRKLMKAPETREVERYFISLRDSLDSFLNTSRGVRHQIEAIMSSTSAFFSVSAVRSSKPVIPIIRSANSVLQSDLEKIQARLRKKHSQWLYFDRNLRIYHRGNVYHLKPMQMLHWSRRQAVLDSEEIIAASLTQD